VKFELVELVLLFLSGPPTIDAFRALGRELQVPENSIVIVNLNANNAAGGFQIHQHPNAANDFTMDPASDSEFTVGTSVQRKTCYVQPCRRLIAFVLCYCNGDFWEA
jgi:hypothetical protein